jgi:hypothetical protein
MAATACRFRDSLGIALSHRYEPSSDCFTRAASVDSKEKATSSRRDPDLEIAKTDFNYGPNPARAVHAITSHRYTHSILVYLVVLTFLMWCVIRLTYD